MLAKKNRIKENKDYLRIFKTIKPVHTEHLAFRMAKRINKIQDSSYKQITNINSQNMGNRNKIAAPFASSMARNDIDAKKLQAKSYKLQSRFGFVISNKIDKRSSRRNGLKRRIRAVVEGKLPEILSGFDVVIQVKKPFDYPYNFDAISNEVLEGLKRTTLYK